MSLPVVGILFFMPSGRLYSALKSGKKRWWKNGILLYEVVPSPSHQQHSVFATHQGISCPWLILSKITGFCFWMAARTSREPLAIYTSKLAKTVEGCLRHPIAAHSNYCKLVQSWRRIFSLWIYILPLIHWYCPWTFPRRKLLKKKFERNFLSGTDTRSLVSRNCVMTS